jgi:hypothetical protein
MTGALSTAKRSAEQLNEQHKRLREAIDAAADPSQARKSLDDLIGSSRSALEPFAENSEMIRAITSLLNFIEDRRRNAEQQAARDPRWLDRMDTWKA